MRASTLFALTAAVLIGLGVAVAAKVGGLFNRPVEVARRPETQVLVAGRNLFAGDTIDASGVRVRALKETEVDAYAKNKDQYLPPVQAAAALRVAKSNIEADTPITRDMLKEMAKPQPINERLLPDMRAVNLTLSKERSAGGLVQVGEWVEVLLTSQIDGGDSLKTTRTAVIAPKVRVIAKRDSLWPVFAPLPAGKPVDYTLEVNAYQAALIEFSRLRGVLSLSPLPQAEQKKLEASRTERLAARTAGSNIRTYMTADTPEEEVKLIQAVEQGSRVISEGDLVKLFDLKVEKESTEPPPVTMRVERFIGTKRVESALFTIDGKPTTDSLSYGARTSRTGGGWPPPPYAQLPPIPGSIAAGEYGRVSAKSGNANSSPQWRFGMPSECKNCNKK